MEFRVLGPLEVWDDDRQVVIGAAKQRALLAALLLHANQTVPTERLIDLLWGARPPHSAKAAVQNYVMRLRRLVNPAGNGSGVLLTKPSGYLVEIHPDQLDLLRFERLAAEARQALARGDIEQAAGLLRTALGLWRGAALADVSDDALRHVEALRLEEQRLAAVDDWVQAELTLGHHREIVAELRELVAAHPLRERLRGQLMLALYRSGRRGDALAVYQDAWRVLTDELGLEPGEELRCLEREILAADPGHEPEQPEQDRAAGPPASGGRRPWPAVAQLPPDVATFTGRDAEVRRLHDLLGAAAQAGHMLLAAVDGPAGIGKSALAVHVAHGMAGRFTGGQLYVNLQGASAGLAPLAPLEVLGRFLRAFGVDGADVPTQLDEATARFRSLVTGRRLLVVLDDARDAGQVRPLLPASSGSAVLVTSRRVLSALDGARVHLDALPGRDAVALLGRMAGQDRVAAEPGAAAEVARWCGRLPLALRIAGARLAARPGWPVEALAERLADEQCRLDELELEEVGVRASFAVSWRELTGSAAALDREAAMAFGVLGLPDGPDVGVPAAARLLDQPQGRAERVLERLVDTQLLETPAPGRYRMHDLLRLYARERAAERHSEPERAAALERTLRMYVATCWRTLALLCPGDRRLAHADPSWVQGGLELADAAQALAWLDAERANLVAAAQQAASTPSVPVKAVIQLAHALYGFFLLHGHWADWLQLNQLALAAAERTGDRAAQALAHGDRGIAFWRLSQYDQALRCQETSLRINRELSDRRGQSASLNNLGIIHGKQGHHDQAVACFAESLAIDRDLGDRQGEAISLINLGRSQWHLGRYERALPCLADSVAIADELGDRDGRATGLANLGGVQVSMGRYDRAKACLDESLAIHRALGNRRGEAGVLTDLGILYQRTGCHDRALACLREALAIDRELGARHGQAEALRELGATLAALGQHRQARQHLTQALALFEQLGSADADEVRALLAAQPTGSPR